MRTGACAVQQTLTTEAASVLKNSLSLARRRGHAQITPLHVAATLLSSRFGLLKQACLKSQPSVNNNSSSSHPLQCRALELCFNVALNRLPASPAPLLHGQPSLSNALIAALKRAQAHQRRGCMEQQQQQQQQPLLAIKVEVEQLVLSILDDPSVSRVMREAGFSSTAVKITLEELSSSVSSVFQAYSSSGGIYSTPSSPPTEIWNPYHHHHHHPKIPEDINANVVTEVLVGRGTKRNVVIVSDLAAATLGVFNELMGKVERGQVPEELKSAHFIKFQFSAEPLTLMRREEVEANMAELKRKVESLGGSGGRGVIIYTGDLKWTVENSNNTTSNSCGYNAVDHLVVEIGRLLSSCTKVWVVGTASFQTYIKCQMRQPPLDVLWALQPVSVPSGALALTLNNNNANNSFQDLKIQLPQNQSQMLDKKPSTEEEHDVVLACCPECTSNYAREAQLNRKPVETKSSDKPSAPLPDWLIPHAPAHKEESAELKRKWNRLCQSLHQSRNSVVCNQGKSFLYTSMYPWWPNNGQTKGVFSETKSISLSDSPVLLKPNQGASSVPRFRRQQSCHIEFSFSGNGNSKKQNEPNLDSLRYNEEDNEVKISLALGNSPISSSGLHNMLHKNLPWQSEFSLSVIHEALMSMHNSGKKQDWLLIRGNDVAGKRRLTRLISQSMFGSADIVWLNQRTKRSALEMALRNHSSRNVFLVESVDLANPQLLKFLADGLYNGKFEGITSCNAIFVLTINDQWIYNNDKDDYTESSVIPMKLQINNESSTSTTSSSSFETSNKDLKRRAEWDSQSKCKGRRGNSMASFTGKDMDLSLDLNIKAEGGDEIIEDSSPISNDLTRDMMNDPLGFLETIKNQVVLNCDSEQEQRAKDMFSSKIKNSLEQVLGENNNSTCLSVDENLTEELLRGCGAFLNSLFEKWLKDILQTSLQQVVDVRNEGVSNVRLCLGEKGDTVFKDGFMGTCLPKRI